MKICAHCFWLLLRTWPLWPRPRRPTSAAALAARPPATDRLCMEAPFSWTGFYVGAHLGYGWSERRLAGGAGLQRQPRWRGGLGRRPDRLQLAGRQVRLRRRGRHLEQLGRRRQRLLRSHASTGWLRARPAGPDRRHIDNRTLFYVTGGGAWADIDYASIGGASRQHSVRLGGRRRHRARAHART